MGRLSKRRKFVKSMRLMVSFCSAKMKSHRFLVVESAFQVPVCGSFKCPSEERP